MTGSEATLGPLDFAKSRIYTGESRTKSNSRDAVVLTFALHQPRQRIASHTMSRQGFQRSQFYGNTPQIEDEAGSYAGLLQEDEADSYADLLQEDEAGSYADLLQILNQDDLNVTASGCNHSIQLSFVTIPGSDADRPWSCKSCELEQVRRDRDVVSLRQRKSTRAHVS